MTKLTCFTTYDIRGKLGIELNNDIAYRIGRAFAQYLINTKELKSKSVIVGGDIRLTSESLKSAVAQGLMDSGFDIIDIGLVGTEEIYFATKYLAVDGGIEITASHNPINYNGMKLVRADAKPISSDTGLYVIQQLAEENKFVDSIKKGTLIKYSNLTPYIDHLMTYINSKRINSKKLVVNSGNGVSGHVIDALERHFNKFNIPITFIKINHEPNGNFPNGIPNPLLPECRQITTDAILKHKADMGIAWDGDFDRCFLFDENGTFIEGYYIVGLLAEAFLQKYPSAKIIHDPRLVWNTIDVVTKAGGMPIVSKTGHAFIKERMRSEDAVYGGEMSAHHYFKDFSYCDSGMIPWLLILELLCIKNTKLSSMVKCYIDAYPSSGEINFKLNNPEKAIQKVRQFYEKKALSIDEIDGISFEFEKWRFNLRLSNTEALIRLNVESRNDIVLLKQKTLEISNLLQR